MKMMKSSVALTVILSLFAASEGLRPASAQTDWYSYQDSKFRYEIAYPEALFGEPEPMLDQGGIALQSLDGSAKLFIFGGVNTSGETIPRFAAGVARLSDIDRVTYKRVTRNWFVLSGFLGGTGDIFYSASKEAPMVGAWLGFDLNIQPANEQGSIT
jgi:hypothetical protein